jgi:hypothetical protein
MWRSVLRLVWQDKWEAVLGIIGILMAVGAGIPPWVTALSLLFALLLLADLVQAVRHTYRLVREKHVPLAVVVGKGDDQYRAMVRAVLEKLEKRGFREREFQSTFHVEREDWVVRREQRLSPQQWAWEDLVVRFQARVNRLTRLLPGRRILHVFLNCPIALALGMGAATRRTHELLVYHLHWGTEGVAYRHVVDFTRSAATADSAPPLRGQVARPYAYIEVEEPEALTPETYVSFHLADHDPRSHLQALADQRRCAAVHIRNTCGDVLPPDVDWTLAAHEVAAVVRTLAARPGVKRLHLGISCPVSLAFTIGMGLGTPSAITVYSWFKEEQVYHPVLALDQLDRLGQ